MSMVKRLGFALSFAAMLSACGGDGGSVSAPSDPVLTVPGTGTGTTSGCTLRARQDWASAQLKEWYLFPETLPASLDPTPYKTVDDYIDALTATARSQGRDRYFTYLTSIAQENAFNTSGSTAGFGVRLSYDTVANRVFIMEAFEGAPALAAGIDRGTEILAIGTNSSDLKSVSSIIATGGAQGVSDALGPSTVGTTRLLRIKDAAGNTRDVSVAKADYDLSPLSSRYGAQVIVDGARKVGYINLRTFILSANAQLTSAVSQFQQQGITNIIVDMRYNGGGLISVADHFGDLLGRNRSSSDLFERLKFRPEKASNDSTHYFAPQAESVAPTKIAFIGTKATASASELMISAMLPYLHGNEALVGTNTYGKPVGQIAVDNAPCDDRFRIIAFAVQNANGLSDYFSGIAGKMEATCQAADDLSHPLGDPQEASIRAALNYLGGQSCAPITGSASDGISPQGTRETAQELVIPDRPNEFQRIMPGAY
jgi:C-terminal processing protease CtpA/Prc